MQILKEGTSQLLNLETNESRDLPYRKGWRYYNSYGNLAIYARLIGFNENEQAIELWNTDNWRKIILLCQISVTIGFMECTVK